jgi:prolyl-tRNA editing enzyme YbaK/EbsC (Cys-tRNA(Pro) deacylase)
VAVSTFVSNVAALGLEFDIREMDDTTHTAEEAAAALGCSVAAIVKSLLFAANDEFVLVLASGVNRVDTDLVSEILGTPVAMANAKAVKIVTGYSIGGVPPLGHPTPIATIIDESLLALPEVWAAAGSARAVFPIEPHELATLTNATVARVS